MITWFGMGEVAGRGADLAAAMDASGLREDVFAALVGVGKGRLARLARRERVPVTIVAAVQWISLAARVARTSAERRDFGSLGTHHRRSAQAVLPSTYLRSILRDGRLPPSAPAVDVRWSGNVSVFDTACGTGPASRD